MDNVYFSYTTDDYYFTSNNCNTGNTLISNYLLQDKEIPKLKEQIKILTAQNKALKLLLKLNS